MQPFAHLFNKIVIRDGKKDNAKLAFFLLLNQTNERIFPKSFSFKILSKNEYTNCQSIKVGGILAFSILACFEILNTVI